MPLTDEAREAFSRRKLELNAWLADGGPCCEAGFRAYPDDCPWHPRTNRETP